ncbi:MAG: PilZ domain-containing protein [Bryobacteraceae bacterium]|jgi:hypothetical protein
MEIAEKRRHDRLLCAGLVEVRWSDKDGFPCETVANLDNLSPGGACLRVDCPIPPGTRIAVGHLIGQVEAEIRHCSSSELGWVVGVQFLTGKTPGIKACDPSHCVDPKTVIQSAQLPEGLQLSRDVRSTVECLTLYEAVCDKEF